MKCAKLIPVALGVPGLVVPLAFAGPAAAGGAAGGPCEALNEGRSRYPAGSGGHALFAVASGYGTTEVTVTECVRKSERARWRTFLITSGHIGRGGFAEPGAKREGDGRTPTGSYSLTEAFGEGDPGTALRYRRLRESGDCWGSTIGDRRYNRHYRGTCLPADEDLSAIMRKGSYRQAVVVNYNRPPDGPVEQGKGSAIFVHVGSGQTTGCVSLDRNELETVMRTLRPRDRIIMGTRAALFR
ncbi:L,D-transpeptidase family protein [Spirillospora sp. NBC_00431]